MTPIQIKYLNQIWNQSTGSAELEDAHIEQGTGADLIALANYQKRR